MLHCRSLLLRLPPDHGGRCPAAKACILNAPFVFKGRKYNLKWKQISCLRVCREVCASVRQAAGRRGVRSGQFHSEPQEKASGFGVCLLFWSNSPSRKSLSSAEASCLLHNEFKARLSYGVRPSRPPLPPRFKTTNQPNVINLLHNLRTSPTSLKRKTLPSQVPAS